MRGVIGKIRTGLSRPGAILPYLQTKVLPIYGLLGASRYLLAGLYLADLVDNNNRFQTHLETNEDDRYIECDVLDFKMRVDALDEGLSRELLSRGRREPLATTQYREQLNALEAERGALTVIDIGANLGYFALQYPAQSHRDGDVIAIEPLPANFSLLQENVRLNDFEDSIQCYQYAVGARDQTTTMHVSTHSNWGTVGDPMGMTHFIDEIEVPMTSLDSFLRENDIPFESVDAVRMDVQGYEGEVIRGMTELLHHGNIGLLFLELHPWYLDPKGEYDDLITTLQDAGFEISFVADGRTGVLREDKSSYSERKLEITSLEALRDIDFTTEVILRRRQE